LKVSNASVLIDGPWRGSRLKAGTTWMGHRKHTFAGDLDC